MLDAAITIKVEDCRFYIHDTDNLSNKGNCDHTPGPEICDHKKCPIKLNTAICPTCGRRLSCGICFKAKLDEMARAREAEG